MGKRTDDGTPYRPWITSIAAAIFSPASWRSRNAPYPASRRRGLSSSSAWNGAWNHDCIAQVSVAAALLEAVTSLFIAPSAPHRVYQEDDRCSSCPSWSVRTMYLAASTSCLLDQPSNATDGSPACARKKFSTASHRGTRV